MQNTFYYDLWDARLSDRATIGVAPSRVQPNGVELFVHVGNKQMPYAHIVASFPVAGPPPPPSLPTDIAVAIPVFGIPWFLLLVAGIALLSIGFSSRRRYSA
ncbi:MAG: hypothetical protein LBS40_07520 [Burkholderiales bacterium]|jgi:hypothetical protein|nr:hypothetical protein [Burkholderiales bacterium]